MNVVQTSNDDGIPSRYKLAAASVTDCLTQTGNPGTYIYENKSTITNRPETGCGGCIITIGYEENYCIRICVTTFNNLYIAVYQPGISYGSWKKIG